MLEDIRLSLVEAPNPMVMMDLILALPKEKLNLSCILMWNWWMTRNKVNAGEAARPEAVICSSIQKHAIEFAAPSVVTTIETEQTGSSLLTETLAWVRPEQDQVKVNVDAAYWEPHGTWAWGFIVRDDKDEFVAAAAGHLRVLLYKLRPRLLSPRLRALQLSV
jgi:hypothetical protein